MEDELEFLTEQDTDNMLISQEVWDMIFGD